jgi:hypothetical protein
MYLKGLRVTISILRSRGRWDVRRAAAKDAATHSFPGNHSALNNDVLLDGLNARSYSRPMASVCARYSLQVQKVVDHPLAA